MEGYSEIKIFHSNVGDVFAQTICFVFCREARSTVFVYKHFLHATQWILYHGNAW